MISYENSLEQIETELKKIVSEQTEELQYCIEKEPLLIISPFEEAMDGLFDKIEYLQSSGKKDKIQYICFSTLYSDFLQGKNVIRVDAYNTDKYIDPQEVYVEWNLDFFFDNKIDLKLNQLYRNLSSSLIPVTCEMEYGIEWLYRTSIYSFIYEFIPFLTNYICKRNKFLLVQKEKTVTFSMGEYMYHQKEFLQYSDEKIEHHAVE